MSIFPDSAPTDWPSVLRTVDDVAPGWFLASVLDDVECGVLVYDKSGAIQKVNRKACELLGLTEDQIHGRTATDPCWNVVGKDGKSLLPNQFPSVLAQETLEPVHDAEIGVYRQLTMDRVWLRCAAVPRLSPRGELLCVVVTVVDTTEQRRASEARDAERLLRAEVMRTVPAGVLVLDQHDRIHHASDEARRLLSLPGRNVEPLELQGLLVDTLDRPLPRRGLPAQRVRESQRPLVGARYVWTSPSGRRRVLLVNGARLDTKNLPDGVVLSFHDITQEEATARAIRYSERRLGAALRAANLGRLDVDFLRRSISVDRNWIARHGFPLALAEADFDLWLSRMSREDNERLDSAFRSARKTEQGTLELDMWVRASACEMRRVRVLGQLEDQLESGRCTRFTGVMMDITAEHEARLAAERLEARAAEMARLEGITAVSGGVAHTFSNLLMGVMGAVHEAREGIDDDSELARALDTIADAGARANAVTTQLRAISGKSRFSLVCVNLDQVVADARDLLDAGLHGRATLVLDTRASAAPVEVDVDQLRLLLMNLVLNSADALTGTDRTISVHTREVEVGPELVLQGLASPGHPAPGRYVLLEVSDNGHGMSADVQHRMFEPFFTTRPDHQGLGLSAVLGIARGHDGFVQVHSVPDRGTRVSLGLPVSMCCSPVVVPPPEESVPDVVPRQTRILVVDDEAIICKLVARVLQRACYEVETVSGGHEALDILAERADEIGLLIADLTMPEMSGRELLDLVLDRWPDLPVLVMSGYTDDAMVARLLGEGRISFLTKPFGGAALKEAVEKLVGVPAAAEA